MNRSTLPDSLADPPKEANTAETIDHVPSGRSPVQAGAATLGEGPLTVADPHDAPTVLQHKIEHPSAETVDSVRPARANSTPTINVPAAIAGYEILGVLGRGAMGVVYKARQPGLNRIVALKMILAGGHADEDELIRFRNEAQAVAQLQHPNIVQVFEVGEDQGLPFLSLEYVDGVSLDKKVRAEALPPREVARLGRDLAQAMDYAHKRGVIHRDLKPANVLLTTDGAPKIADFGLAKRLEGDAGQTRTGTVVGTPSYMAPEQAAGKVGQVGPLADVYSLGAVIYDLLTGRAPFRGTTLLETLEQVSNREPVPPVELQPGVPRDLETICMKCLQKDRSRRYAGAAALADDLGRFLNGEPILARPVSRPERLWRWCKRNPRVAALTVAVIGLVLIWTVTSSALLGLFNEQKHVAEQQAALALNNEKIAKDNEEQAKKAMLLAERNEKRAKDTATVTVRQMVNLGEVLHKRLQTRSLSVQAAPEVKRLREEVLGTLRKSLADLSGNVEGIGATPYARLATSQAMGDLLAKLGQGHEALRVYKQGADLAKKLAEAEPNRDESRGNLGVMLLRLGDIALDLNGDARAAVDFHKQARDVHDDIRVNPRNGYYKDLDFKRLLSHDDIRLGKAQLALGDPAQAGKTLQEALAFRKAWSTAEPKRVEARSYVMEAHMWSGVAAGHRADAAAVAEHFGAALRMGADLIRAYPKAVDFKEDLAEVQGHYGDALFGSAS